MNIQFRKAEERDAAHCVDLAVRAFWNDAFLRAAAGSVKNYRLLMELLARAWLKSQTAFVAEHDGRIIALAVLAPEKQAAISVRDCWRLGGLEVLRACGWKNIFEFLWVSGKFGKSFKKAAGPKFFLTLLAVEPETQRKGVGSAMLERCVLPYLREQGAKTLCLQTNEKKNREFYLNHQFIETGAVLSKLAGKPITSWGFQREIAGSTPSNAGALKEAQLWK